MAYIGNAPYQGSVAGTNILDGTIETVDLKDGNVTGAKLETLAGLTSGTYGNSTAIPTITIDVKGRVTAISTTAVSIPSGSISVTGGDLTLSGSTGTAITDATLTSVGTAGTYTKITTDAKGRVTSGTTLASSDLPTYTGTITSSQVTTALGFTPENIANKAVANGYASLDGSGKVPSAQLPSYVDDVLEYANLAAFPVTGSSGIIYVTQDTNKTYRWTGSAYVEISPSPGTTDSLTEGSTNLYYTNTRARASLSFTAGSGAYNSTTGAITIPTNTTHLTNGSGYITGNQTVTLSGDASGSGATAITVTLASSGVTAGTYNNVTVDAKGRVTSGSNTSYLTSYTDTLATVTGRGNSTSTNIGSTSGTPLALATAGNVGTWIGGIQDGTSGWSLSQATIGFKSDNNTYAAIGIGTAQGLLYFGRTTASGVGSMASWLEVNSNGVANFVRARPQHNGSNLALVSEIPSLSGYLTSESDTLATVTGRGATTSTAVTLTYSIGDGTAALRLSPASSSGSFQWASTSLSSGLGSGQTMIHLLGNATGLNNSGYVGYQYGGSAGSTNSFVSLGLYGNDNILRVYGGTYTQSLGSMRAPIFYDSDDTNYYLDPASTSVIKNLKVNTSGTSSATRALTIKADGQAEISFGSYPASWTSALQIQNNNNTDIIWISPLDDGYNARFRTAGSGLDFYTDGGTADVGTYSAFIGSGYLQGISSVRGPIFYDSDNTSYYVDPASTTYLNTTYLQGGKFYTASNNSGNSIDIFMRAHGDDTYVWRHIYGGSGTGYGTGVGGYGIYNQTLGGNYSLLFNSAGYVTAPYSLRSPIFYDSDNTAYYADLSSTGDSIRAAGNIVAYYSDDRLKTKLGNITDALKKVNQLNGFYYQANELAQSLGYKPTMEVGVSAQEVEQILPQIVKPAPIDQQYKTVDYSRLVPLLIEAVKELSQKLSKLEAKYGITS